MSAGLIVRIMHVASSSSHYKPVTRLHRPPIPVQEPRCGARGSLQRCRQEGRSGLLADELHWPSRERITPTLCFWFAIDCGGRIVKYPLTHSWSIPKKCHRDEATTFSEGLTPDTSDTIRDRDARHATAVTEGAIPDVGNTIRNCDAR